MFVLSSDITIGTFRFSGVNEVQISRSMHSIVETAVIKIPSIARIISNGKVQQQSIVTGKQFKEGDAVKIKLGYNAELNTEFNGFVSRCSINMPLEISCEGYSWLLRRNNASGFHKDISLKHLLEIAVSGIEGDHKISVQCSADIQLSNVSINSQSGFDIINSIEDMTDGAVSCCFIQADILWCGLPYTSLANGIDPLQMGEANYRPGYNALKENTLVVRNNNTDPVEVAYTKKKPDGTVISQSSTVFKNAAKKYRRILNNIADEQSLALLANERAYKMSYTGYEGTVTGFLQPCVTAGCLANLQDTRYPERDGKYLVEGIKVQYGMKGARRVVEIGPMLVASK